MRQYFFLIFFIITSFNLKAQSTDVIRGPYLQKGTSHSVTIRWRTGSSVSGKVSFKKEGETVASNVTENTSKTDHLIELTGLEPNEKYYYEIGVIGEEASIVGDKYFKTFPVDTVKEPFRIKVTGDFGVVADGFWAPTRERVYNAFKSYNNDREINLWLWLGDNAYSDGRDEEFQTNVFDYYDKELFSNTQIAPVVGNHEYRYESGSENTRNIPFFDIITVPTLGEGGGVPSYNKAFFSFDVGNFHFIGLDTYGRDDGKKIFEFSDQYDWLVQDLQANTKQWTVVFMHHAPYAWSSHNSDTDWELIGVREALVPLFDQYKVDLVLTGHNHIFQRSYLIKGHIDHSSTFDFSEHVVQPTKGVYDTNWPPFINKDEGTIYAIVGSSGKLDWNYFSPHPVSVKNVLDPGGTMMLTLESNRLDAEWVDENGDIQDRFTILKEVNKTDTLFVMKKQEVTLEASWPGEYNWSHDAYDSRKVTFIVEGNSQITVNDPYQYLQDKFIIKCYEEPVLNVTINNVFQEPCSQPVISGEIEVDKQEFSDETFLILLSDKDESFNFPIVLDTTNNKTFSYTIPEGVEGGNYKIKAVLFRYPELDAEPSAIFHLGSYKKVNLIAGMPSEDYYFAEKFINSSANLSKDTYYGAEKNIVLKPGFYSEAKTGVFKAEIINCEE